MLKLDSKLLQPEILLERSILAGTIAAAAADKVQRLEMHQFDSLGASNFVLSLEDLSYNNMYDILT